MAAWLKETNQVDGDYGHLLLEQQAPIDPAQLRPYFESAHLDAREVFHGDAGLDLHPDAGAPGTHAQYPACLPPTARRDLFGYIEGFYNSRRLHSALGYVSPAEAERRAA